MAQSQGKKLDSGDMFPSIEFKLTDGNSISLPDTAGDEWVVLLIYRGGWWAFCHQQLADFQARISEFEKRKIKVIGASVDSLEDAKKIVEQHKISFPISYGLNAEHFASVTGAYYDEKKGFIHATGFVIKPNNRIGVAIYSTGAIGRLTATDLLVMLDFMKTRGLTWLFSSLLKLLFCQETL